MMSPSDVASIIRQGLPCEHLAVDGDGHHFEALIVSAEFAGLSRVRRQKRVLDVVRSHLDSGELHALSMKTLTADEWAAEQARG
jgi:acid stress-induced BolA-like protein IbaG/YrbA